MNNIPQYLIDRGVYKLEDNGSVSVHLENFWKDEHYKEKCEFIAAHAKGRAMTPEGVDAEIHEALKHPLLALFMDAESLADATIAQIKKEQESGQE